MAWTPDYTPKTEVITNREGQYFHYSPQSGWQNLGSSLPSIYSAYAPGVAVEGSQTMIGSTPTSTGGSFGSPSSPSSSGGSFGTPLPTTPSPIPSSSSVPSGGVAATPTQGQYGNIPIVSPGTLNIQGSGGFPSLTFDFAKEQALAYEQLKPFYEKLLSFAGNNFDLAKRILQYTYDQGMRESDTQYEQEARSQALTFPVETSQKTTEQNRRGILSSGFGQVERDRLKQSQLLRQEAIQRAREDRASRLGAQKGFGLEEKTQAFDEKSFDLERERRQESSSLAQNKFGIKQTEYQARVEAAQRAEQERIRKEEQDFQRKIYAAQGINV